MNPLIIVEAHGAEQATFDRHLPLWEAHKHDIVVFCPEDDPVKTLHPTNPCFKAAHHGEQAWLRRREILRCCGNDRLHDWFIFFEYDSFCLDPIIQFLPGLRGNIGINYDPDRFMAQRYPVPPWTMDVNAVEVLWGTALYYPLLIEEGQHDRMIGAYAHFGNLPVFWHDPKGFGMNTILPEHYEGLKAVLKAGGTMIHGCKTEECLKFIMENKP
jgi:hypothetical protein